MNTQKFDFSLPRRAMRSWIRPAVLVGLAVAPAVALLPGCGGGGGGSTKITPVDFQVGYGVILTDGAGNEMSRANLVVTYPDIAQVKRDARATLQVLGAITPTPAPPSGGSSGRSQPAKAGAKTNGPTVGDPFYFSPALGSYLTTGSIFTVTNNAAPDIDLKGAIAQGVPFTITGTFAPGHVLKLVAKFNSGDGLADLVVQSDVFNVPRATPTPNGTPNPSASPSPSASASPSPVPTLIGQ